MFGALVDDERGWGRLARRRVVSLGRAPRGAYGDVDWGALATATAGLVTGIATVVVKSQQTNTQQNQPQGFYCPTGYIWDQPSGQCVRVVGPANTGGLFGMDPMTIGAAGLLAIVLLSGD